MALFQKRHQVIEVTRCSSHLRVVGDNPEGAKNIVCILGTLSRDNPVEDDVHGLLEGKLGAFDVVGEIGLEEGEVRFG